MGIRLAALADAEAILAVYAPFVENTCVSFETSVPSLEEFRERMKRILSGYPYLVWEEGGRVIGYAYASRHREREAYRFGADVSIYVHPDYHRQGIGRALYERLIHKLMEQGYYTCYAGITLPNEKSVGLHEAMGFERVGVYHNTGYKQGKWHDVLWLEKALRPFDTPMELGPYQTE